MSVTPAACRLLMWCAPSPLGRAYKRDLFAVQRGCGHVSMGKTGVLLHRRGIVQLGSTRVVTRRPWSQDQRQQQAGFRSTQGQSADSEAAASALSRSLIRPKKTLNSQLFAADDRSCHSATGGSKVHPSAPHPHRLLHIRRSAVAAHLTHCSASPRSSILDARCLGCITACLPAACQTTSIASAAALERCGQYAAVVYLIAASWLPAAAAAAAAACCGSQWFKASHGHAMQKMFAPLDHVDLAQALEFHEANFRSLGPAPRSYLRQGEHNKCCQVKPRVQLALQAVAAAAMPCFYALPMPMPVPCLVPAVQSSGPQSAGL